MKDESFRKLALLADIKKYRANMNVLAEISSRSSEWGSPFLALAHAPLSACVTWVISGSF